MLPCILCRTNWLEGAFALPSNWSDGEPVSSGRSAMFVAGLLHQPVFKLRQERHTRFA
jgi:hypothetical protein